MDESNLANAYLEAYEIACAALKGLDADAVALSANVPFERETGVFSLRYLGRGYAIKKDTGAVRLEGGGHGGEEIPVPVKALLLHYLIHATPRPLSGRLISFKDIPGGGSIYADTFHKRAVLPLLKTFAARKDLLYAAAERLDGERERYGHASVTLRVFPLVPVTYVVWEGDEEVASSATILFDDSVTGYLPVEDIVLAASYGTYALVGLAKAAGKEQTH